MEDKKKEKEISIPADPTTLNDLKTGDIIYLTGKIMTARDHAHKKIIGIDQSEKKIPKIIQDMKNCAIYHCGPIIHELIRYGKKEYNLFSGGPTTSARMEGFQEKVCNILDIRIVIGKGGMKNIDFSNFNGVYLSFTGGCGAIFSKFTKKIVDVVWLKELGMPEAVWIIEVDHFGPLIVTQDSYGNILHN